MKTFWSKKFGGTIFLNFNEEFLLYMITGDQRESFFMFNDNAFSGSHVDFASHVASYALGEDW